MKTEATELFASEGETQLLLKWFKVTNTVVNFTRRINSISFRAESLTNLRELASLPPDCDLNDKQWALINYQLEKARDRILSGISAGAGRCLPYIDDLAHEQGLNHILGKGELDLAKAFSFFDTYMDLLTQRNSPELGPVLAGCDSLARDALIRNHPALQFIISPLVYCDRGFGASILREGISLPDGSRNPVPLIQIPYSRLKEKYNLTSILHEAGHQAIVLLKLARPLCSLFDDILEKAGASKSIRKLFTLWSLEIGPDFWGFCGSGIAQVATMKEIFALPVQQVFRISPTDPHPPGYLRTLLSIECCRQLWGNGIWDDWKKDWMRLYPLEDLNGESEEIIYEAKKLLPRIANALLNTKFRTLNGKRISDLFDLKMIEPGRLCSAAGTLDSGLIRLHGLSPCSHLAVFRLVRETTRVDERELDLMMSKWLLKLGTN